MPYQLRPYQEKAIRQVRDALLAGAKSVCICAPTGAGKTVIASHIIESAAAKASRTLAVAHRTELIDQLAAKLSENGVSHGIIKAGRQPDPYQRTQVGSVQTYGRRMDGLEHGYKLIIIDECHHAPASGYQKIIAANPDAIVLGLTATPYRLDGKGLKGTFQTLVNVATIQELTDMGFLVPSRVMISKDRPDLRGVHTKAGDYDVQELDAVMRRQTLISGIVSAWQKYSYGRLTVCFATTVAHSKAIQSEFQRQGVACEHLDGETPEEERRGILERLASGRTTIVTNCAVLTEGWDCPQCASIILARPTKSRGLWRQCAGRVLRPAPLKTHCLILDHANCTETHGYITDPDTVTLEDGMKAVDVLRKWKCKICGVVLNSAPRYCPKCGVDTRPEGQLDMGLLADSTPAGYEMIEVNPAIYQPKVKTYTPDNLRFMYLGMLRKGRKPMQCNMIYKSIAKRWPPSELIAEGARIAAQTMNQTT